MCGVKLGPIDIGDTKGSLLNFNDHVTNLSDSLGVRETIDDITSPVTDALASFDDALYDLGVRWDDAGKIALTVAAIYTGGVMAGAWGQGGWLANTLGVAEAGATTTAGLSSTAGAAGSQSAMLASQTAGFGAEGAALTGQALASGGSAGAAAASGLSQGAMLASQTAGFGAEGASLTGQALASSTGGSASLANAGVMSSYGNTALGAGELGGAAGAYGNAAAQGTGLASNGYSALNNAAAQATASPGFGGSSVLYDSAGNVVQVSNNGIIGSQMTGGAAGAGASSGSFLSNPLVQYAGMNMGGQMLSGMAQAQSQQELYDKQMAELERQRQLKGYWASIPEAKQVARAQRGIVAQQMTGV